MRIASLLAVLFLLATSSTVLAAAKAIKFGKLVDGTGRVIPNAVVIVEDDRVQSVTGGNASIPAGAEVIDLSRYTGVPGLIDAHTHITYYWDGNTTPRYEPPRHPAVTAFLAPDDPHALGKKIAINSYGPGGARDAVRAGVDSLEHATDMDDQTIAEMVKRKTYYTPTIDHNQYYVENADNVYHFPPGTKERLLDYIQRNFETAKKAYKAGVHMLVGSDAVYNGWGLNMRELEWFVKMGMKPEQALKAATTEPAAMLGMEKSLGAVAPGFFADIVAVEGDPLTNITAVSRRENIRWVMKAGRVVVDKTKGPEKTN